MLVQILRSDLPPKATNPTRKDVISTLYLTDLQVQPLVHTGCR